MPRRLLLLVSLVIALVAFPGTTGVAAVVHSYDGPITTRVDSHHIATTEAGTGLFSDARDGSAPPPTQPSGASTTLSRSANATNTVGALEEASSAAFRAADNIGDFSVSAKHLPGSGGSWNRFGAGVDPNDAIARALRSPSAQFFPNGEGTFKVVTNLGYQVGEKASQTGVRVIVTTDGRIITAFPVKP